MKRSEEVQVLMKIFENQTSGTSLADIVLNQSESLLLDLCCFFNYCHYVFVASEL